MFDDVMYAVNDAALHAMTLAEDLTDPKACLPPGFSTPVLTLLQWCKALGLLVAVLSLIRIGVHELRSQGDGVPDRDDTYDKLFKFVVGALLIGGAVSLVGALGLTVATGC